MARKRDLSPDIWTDERVLALTLSARLLYVGLISQADDKGRLEWSPRQLAARIVPGESADDVSSWMAEVASVRLVERYEADGRVYAYHPRWDRHQSPSRQIASRLPDPEDGVPLTTDQNGSPLISTDQDRSELKAPATGTATGVSVAKATSSSPEPTTSQSGDADGVARLREAWNARCAPLPEATKQPRRGGDRWRVMVRAWPVCLEDPERLSRAIDLFAADPFNRDHRPRPFGIDTFCRHAESWLDAAAAPANPAPLPEIYPMWEPAPLPPPIPPERRAENQAIALAAFGAGAVES